MMALEFTKPVQLEIFLVSNPVQWSRLIAARAALRVLPVALSGMPDKHWLSILRACFISWAAGKFPAHDMNAAADYAARSARSAARSARSAARSAALSADYAARSAALSADYAARSAAGSADLSAAGSAGSAARSAAWRATSTDAEWLKTRAESQSVADLALSPLWLGEPPRSIAQPWQSFAESGAAAAFYGPWINWYQALLTGNGPNADYFGPDLTLRIAQQPDEWWDRPAEAVNADIAAWLRQRDEERIDIPEPEPGTSMGIAGDGRIGIVPTGVPSSDERSQFEGLLEVLGEKADELAELLAGSNAFANLLKDVRKYADVVRQQVLSIDRLYARGNVLENTRAHLQKDIDAGNLPDMALGVAAGLDSILSIHGPLIASTQRGQQLLESSHLYESKAADIAENRLVARRFGDAIAGSRTTFTDEVREEIPRMADDIDTGPYPERSNQLALSGLKNLLIALAKIVAVSIGGEAIITSIPGAMAVGSLKETINLVWAFMTEYLPIITQFVNVIGPTLAWMKPVLRLISRGRG